MIEPLLMMESSPFNLIALLVLALEIIPPALFVITTPVPTDPDVRMVSLAPVVVIVPELVMVPVLAGKFIVPEVDVISPPALLMIEKLVSFRIRMARLPSAEMVPELMIVRPSPLFAYMVSVVPVSEELMVAPALLMMVTPVKVPTSMVRGLAKSKVPSTVRVISLALMVCWFVSVVLAGIVVSTDTFTAQA